MKPTFEWDPTKAATNLKKHSVAFREATTVLADPLSITVLDPGHSDDEERIRIISARKAPAAERRRYEESHH